MMEVGFRILDPFVFISPDDINSTEHGNLSQYDSLLGWKGVPNGREVLVTPASRTLVELNRLGFRDIDHEMEPQCGRAIVFLGDSFTWGFEVEFEDMFVNLLRPHLEEYDVYNLSHRGYSTDQSLLTFNSWEYDGQVELVVLMFYENDIVGNNRAMSSEKAKPLFVAERDDLLLTNVPVPRAQEWDAPEVVPQGSVTPLRGIQGVLFESHFLYDMAWRAINLRKILLSKLGQPSDTDVDRTGAIHLTAALLGELRDRAVSWGSQLIVIAIPDLEQFAWFDKTEPYQARLEQICRKLEIDYLDLAPHLQRSFRRTYYRRGLHWTAHGHRKAAEAILDYLVAGGFVE